LEGEDQSPHEAKDRLGSSLHISIRGRVEEGGKEDGSQAAEAMEEGTVEEMFNKGVILNRLRGDRAKSFEGGRDKAMGGVPKVVVELPYQGEEGLTVRRGYSSEPQSDCGEEGV
jgi:hypothetical protein